MGEFVQWRMSPFGGVSSEPVMIWGRDKTSLLDSVRLRNETGGPVSAFLDIQRYVTPPDGTTPVLETWRLEGPVALGAFETRNVALDMTMEAGDLLWASSDDVTRTFSVFVSGRVLLESVPS